MKSTFWRILKLAVIGFFYVQSSVQASYRSSVDHGSSKNVVHVPQVQSTKKSKGCCDILVHCMLAMCTWSCGQSCNRPELDERGYWVNIAHLSAQSETGNSDN